jgi:hypothetical protein
MREITRVAFVIVMLWTTAVSYDSLGAYGPPTNTIVVRPRSSGQLVQNPGGRPPGFSQNALHRPSSTFEAASERARETLPAGGRDPFRLPPPPSHSAGNTNSLPAYLPPGPRGLVIGQLTLKGVVWDDSGRTEIAIVTNKTQEAYFLRQNEEVYDGVVTRITPDAIYFRKRVLISSGETGFRVVVKQLRGLQGE